MRQDGHVRLVPRRPRHGGVGGVAAMLFWHCHVDRRALCFALLVVCYRRLGVAVDKKAFVKEAMNVIDLLAILPFYISLVPGVHGTTARAISVVRVIRLLKVSRHSRGIQNMSMCMWATRSELALFVIMVTVCTILFATALFYTEYKQKDSNFQSIPDAFWWAIISMTTVGYGDVFPVTEWGRLVASLCVSVCVIAVAIPASIFISEFLKLHHLDDTISEIQPGAPSGLHVLRCAPCRSFAALRFLAIEAALPGC